MRFQFIKDHRDKFPVRRMCKVLGVSPSGYYARRKRPTSAREMANRELLKRIQAVFEESGKTYGSPRVHQALKQQEVRCSKNRVARLMRLCRLQAKQTKRYKTTTRRNKAHPVAPNLLQRDFTANRPDQKWLADITFISTRKGWLYLATILDAYSRRIVGWAMSKRMTDKLTIAALRMAFELRQPAPGLIHHSDQGAQYTSHAYQDLLSSHGIQVSMNSIGSWYDNAPMESFFGTLKGELVHHNTYLTREQARSDIFFYIEAYYNRRRLHSSLDYVSPVAYEQTYLNQGVLRLTPCPQN